MPPAHVLSPRVQPGVLITGWNLGALGVAAMLVEIGLMVGYLVGASRLRRRGRRWSPWRTTSFVAGTIVVVVALQSGLAAYDDRVFWAHVLQHILLMNIAPVLFVLAAPVTLAMQASTRPVQTRIVRLTHHPVVSTVSHPAAVTVNFYGTMLVYFLTPFYQWSLEHTLVHELVHLHLLVIGCLFWWLVVGTDPSRWHLSHPQKLAMLAAGIPVTAMLGLSLTGARTSIAPAFHTVGDIHVGGALMWVVGELTTLAIMSVVVLQWMRFEERQAVRADRIADAEEARLTLALAEVTGGLGSQQSGQAGPDPLT